MNSLSIKNLLDRNVFSLEGAETTIPALDAVIERGSELGIEEFVIGMAHRGRLNVLTNILKKPYEDVFREFAAIDYDEEVALGDVQIPPGIRQCCVHRQRKGSAT